MGRGFSRHLIFEELIHDRVRVCVGKGNALDDVVVLSVAVYLLACRDVPHLDRLQTTTTGFLFSSARGLLIEATGRLTRESIVST